MRLLLFDVDDTLVKSWTTELLPGRAEFFAGLNSETKVALVSNQGGVGLRRWMETAGWGDPTGLPTSEEVNRRMVTIAKALGLSGDAGIYISFAYQTKAGKWAPDPDPIPSRNWDRRWRKPLPGMILAAMEDFGITDDVTMIGNSPEDQRAAAAAGVNYIDAAKFFV